MGLRKRAGSERGAAMVEFALLLPVFVMLVLGMFSGGLTYNRKLTLTNAAREASRYGATLPVDDGNAATTNDMQVWLEALRDVAISAATGELDNTDEGQYICVAYVREVVGAPANDITTKIEVNEGTQTGPSSGVGNTCFADGRPADERRVQVRVGRDAEIELGLFPGFDITLRSHSVTKYERVDL